MVCSLVHGNSNQQPGVRATPEDSLQASSPVPEIPTEPVLAVAAPSPAPSPVPVALETGANFGQAYIKVVGCGGGGGNAISRMISAGLQVRIDPAELIDLCVFGGGPASAVGFLLQK
jgi:hypothetical protein